MKDKYTKEPLNLILYDIKRIIGETNNNGV